MDTLADHAKPKDSCMTSNQENKVDHPGAAWIPVPHVFPGGVDRKIRYVVIHTVEGSFDTCIEWFRNPASRVSAHYLVSLKGDIAQMVRDRSIARHTGEWEYNLSSIGIEHEGYAEKNLWTLEQYRASAQITRRICLEYGIPMTEKFIISHQSIAPQRKIDPGPHFDWDFYLKLVKGES